MVKRDNCVLCSLALLLLLLPILACSGGPEVWLEGRTLAFEAEGLADDGSPATAPAQYEAEGPGASDLWAQDSLTTAYADPPRPGRLTGGVAAEPGDTVGSASPGEATARSVSRITVPMEVRKGGRVQLEILLELTDVELSNSGVPRVAVTGTIAGDDGATIPGGDLGTLELEILPDGTVLVDEGADQPDRLDVTAGFSRVLRGPVGGVELGRGRYQVTIELGLEATAPARSGPGQLARIGQARASLRIP